VSTYARIGFPVRVRAGSVLRGPGLELEGIEMNCYLRIGDDYLEDAKRFASVRAACAHFRGVAEELDRYGQQIEASIHLAPSRDDVAEYPDFVLSLGPRGGLRVERA